jgi:hypothetical protein
MLFVNTEVNKQPEKLKLLSTHAHKKGSMHNRVFRPDVICALLLFVLGSGLLEAQSTAPVVWTESSLSRIWKDTSPGSTNHVEIYSAKNETSSFQIGIQAPSRGLTNVNVTNSDLSGPNGAVIGGSNVALFREQYVSVPAAPAWLYTGSNPPGQAGLYPDGLIPFVDPETGSAPQGGTLRAVPFAVAAGNNQPIWVDVTVPASAEPGTYTGTFTIRSDQGQATAELTLHVWNFALPVAPSFKSAYHATGAHQDLYLSHELLRNRTSPDWVTLQDERTLIDQWGLNATNLWFSSGLGISNCLARSMPLAPSVSDILARKTKHQPDLLIYDFSADEIGRCPNVFSSMKRWAANLHAAGVKNLVTVVPTPALEDDGTGTGRSAVDIWTVLPRQYDESNSEIQKVLAKGDSIWLYNVLVQDDYSPKLESNFSPLDFRLSMGFISQSLRITGFQQWQVDQWSQDPWNQVALTGGVPDGGLVYPGGPVGLVGYAPSMRLKWIRDGTDDYEYVQILKGMGQGDWALQQAMSVGQDWRNWTRDYTQVDAVRIALGNAIDALSTGVQ